MECISSYWNGLQTCQCPVCKETFTRRPDLKVNTFISELTSQFSSLQWTNANIGGTDLQQVGDGSPVPCDICTEARQEAVKSCVECLTSYCKVHLEPHYRVAGLKRHTLVDPVAALEDRICGTHNRLLALFCSDDNLAICSTCASSDHAGHRVVPVQRAHHEMKRQLVGTEEKVQEEIRKRLDKVQSVKEASKQSKADTAEAIAKSEQEFTELVLEIQKNRADVVRVMKERQKANEEQADGFIRDLEQEAAALQKTAAELRTLNQTEDSFRFLQRYSEAPLPPHAMDPSTFSPDRHLEIQHIQKSVSKWVSDLRLSLNQMSADIKKYSTEACVSDDISLRYAQQHEVSITLSATTAHPLLIISDDRKQVRFSGNPGLWEQQVNNPNMFTENLGVLGQKGFSSGKFYFEVFVGGKTEFCLGVATASIPRKRALPRTSNSGLWAIWLMMDKFEDFNCPDVPVCQKKAEQIGVYVDYDGGEVSFFDVKAATLIYSFSDCRFTEKLYPYFNPCDNEYGYNWDPMIIVPICRAD